MYRTLLTLSIVVLLCAASVPPESASFIVFATNRDGNYEIYVMNDDGTDQKNLTRNPAQDRDPAWSPDGKRIAFTSDRDGNNEIYVMNADGRNQRRLTFNPGSDRYPTWSPDCRKIAFTSDRDINDEIYVIDVNTKTLERLTRKLSFDSRASWSPDGSKIAYDSSGLHQNRYPYDIYVMDTDGKHKTNLTNYVDRNSDPSWSPDGKQIAFVKRTGNFHNVFVMDADGKNQVNVTDYPAGNWDPCWSPDGKKIGFASDRQLPSQIQSEEGTTSSGEHQSLQEFQATINPPRDIYIIDLNEKMLKRLTNDENDIDDDMVDDTYPSWCHLQENGNFFYAAFLVIVILFAAIFLKKSLNRK